MAVIRYSIKVKDKNNNEWWFNGFNYEGYALKGKINKFHATKDTCKKIKQLLDNSFEEFTKVEIIRKKEYNDNDIIDAIHSVNEVNLLLLP